jgi:hypothetical protein
MVVTEQIGKGDLARIDVRVTETSFMSQINREDQVGMRVWRVNTSSRTIRPIRLIRSIRVLVFDFVFTAPTPTARQQ